MLVTHFTLKQTLQFYWLKLVRVEEWKLEISQVTQFLRSYHQKCVTGQLFKLDHEFVKKHTLLLYKRNFFSRL